MDGRLPGGPDKPAGVPRTVGPGTAGSGANRPVDPGLERRLAALEARLDDLDEAIREVLPGAIGRMVETACRQAVEDEMQQVGENLRRSVSELGRLLLRDLDRLTRLLAEHRDAIVDRLLEPPPPPPPPPAEEDQGAPGEGEVYVFDPPEDDGEGDGQIEDPPAAGGGEEGKRRVLPGRRRRSRREGQDEG